MKRVVVKVTNNSQLEEVKDSILGQHSYLTFVDKFRSFGILTVDVPEENEDDALGDIRGVEGVKSAFWDKENIVCDPVEIAQLQLNTMKVPNTKRLEMLLVVLEISPRLDSVQFT